MYTLLAALAGEAERAEPGARTLLVAPTRGEGREILRALVRETGGWLGLEVTTVRPVALELVGADLAARGLTLLDEFAEQALVDELLDEALAAADGTMGLEDLAEGVGFRRAVRGAVSALRLAGVALRRVEGDALPDPAKRSLVGGVLARLEERLAGDRLVDTASLLARATAALTEEAALPSDAILLLPGLGTRGISGRFLAALRARGARLVPHDPVLGLDPPEGVLWRAADVPPTPLAQLNAPVDKGQEPGTPPPLELFRAAGITEELREVLRRILAAGLRWDEAEIVTPDPGIYGPALHALAAHLDVPVTFAVGLPVERTRAGRAVSAWFRWVEGGFPESVLRRLLEAGDLAPPRLFRDVDGARLARRLHRLRIGWGRDRYWAAIESARRRTELATPRTHHDEEPEDATERQGRELRELAALQALIGPIEGAVPPVPGRVDPAPVQVAPGALASGLATFLDHVPGGGSIDETALERLRRILDRAAATLTRPTTFSAALTILSEHLSIRVPAPRAEGRAPWGSDGAHLHLADIEHGGWTGRRATFVVGLDAARFPGAAAQDPILLDRERAALAPRDLPSSGSLLRERRFRVAALLARLRGSVTLSYAAWQPSEGRTLTPSPLLLQAYRLAQGQRDADFEALDSHFGNPISRIPRGKIRLDAEDVWLRALSRDDLLLDGEAEVCTYFPWLRAGLAARIARRGDLPGPHHGIVGPQPGLDPRKDDQVIVSSSRLEALGTCPLRYFYAYILRIRPPDEASLDPERWLDPLRRGSLLHAVYDRTLDAAKGDGLSPRDDAFQECALAILDEEAEAMSLEVPPPSRVIYERERDDLVSDVLSFVGMLSEDLPQWKETEFRFGFDGAEHPAVELPLPSGRVIRLRGAIDRLDELPSGALRVVDYKTGAAGHYSNVTVWNRGRRLQHLLYTEAAERLLGHPVDRMEYHFPTPRGENEHIRFPRADLREGPHLLDHMLDLVATGHFLPTEQKTDCRFCDFKAVCRVKNDRFGNTASPLADWGKDHFESEPYANFQLVRLFRDRGGKKR